MGSFNTTCNVSKATIRPGQRVMLYFLMEDKFTSNFCNASSTYKPITFGISATYEDAALYHIEPGNYNEINAVVNFVKNSFAKVEDQWGYGVDDFDIENLTPATIVRYIRDYNIFINPHGIKEVRLATTAIIMEVYDHIILAGEEQILLEYNRSKDAYEKDLDFHRQLRRDMNQFRDVKTTAESYDYFSCLMTNVRKENVEVFLFHDMKDYISSDRQEEVLWRCARHLELSRIMEDWNLHWAPCILSGQVYNYSTALDYHKSMLAILEKKEEECREEDYY